MFVLLKFFPCEHKPLENESMSANALLSMGNLEGLRCGFRGKAGIGFRLGFGGDRSLIVAVNHLNC